MEYINFVYYIFSFVWYSGVLVHLIFHQINFLFLYSLSTNGSLYVNMLWERLTIRALVFIYIYSHWDTRNWSHSKYDDALFHWIFSLFYSHNMRVSPNKYHTILIRINAHFCNQFLEVFRYLMWHHVPAGHTVKEYVCNFV